MKIKVITSYTTEVEQTWEVPNNTDLDMIFSRGLPAEAELIGETNVLGHDYYGDIVEIRRIKK